jgi:hypothetical protein
MDEQGIMMRSEKTINQSIKGFDEWSRLKSRQTGQFPKIAPKHSKIEPKLGV